jgi:hypothetical protein
MTQDSSAEQLKALRLAAGLEPAVLARQVSLSPAQLMQLESGQDSLFYSPAIGRQAARKVYFHLTGQWPANAELPSTSPELPAEDAQVQPAASPAAVEPAPVALPAQAPQSGTPSWAIRPVFVASAMLTGLGLMVWLMSGRAIAPAAATPQQLAAQAPATTVPPTDSPSLPSDQPGQSGPALVAVLKGTPVSMATHSDQDLVAMLPTSGLPAAPAIRAELPASARCEDSGEPAVTVHLPPSETRAIRLVSAVSQWICVTDGSGLPSQLRLAAGQGTVLAGPAPWLVQAGSLRQVQIDVQGIKLAWPAELKNRAQLLAPQ